MKDLEIVLDSSFGDCGKGQLTHNLCLRKGRKKTLVVRFSGGPQSGHNVKHENLSHCFSNYGSGTLLQIPTYWSQYCLVDPIMAIAEQAKLIEIGIKPEAIYSPMCEIITPFDIWNQWKNTENREHGTVGSGYKSALDRIKAGYHLTMIDARNIFVLREKIRSIQDNYYKWADISYPSTNFTIDKWVYIVNQYALEHSLKNFSELYNTYDHIIFEGSQGILLDQTFGVMPWCTPSNTTSKNALDLITGVKTDGFIVRPIHIYYVCKPYITRHGPGPLLCDSRVLNIEDPNNPYNEYQKSFRSCEFSVELLMHALEIDELANNLEKYYISKHIVFSHGSELDPELEKEVKEKTGLEVLKFEYEKWL